jgi:hypothetical protein
VASGAALEGEGFSFVRTGEVPVAFDVLLRVAP